jgi:hypothetical protein
MMPHAINQSAKRHCQTPMRAASYDFDREAVSDPRIFKELSQSLIFSSIKAAVHFLLLANDKVVVL